MSQENDGEECNWQSSFVALLPEIQLRLQQAFRQLDPESREDAIAEGVIHGLLSYARLVEQNRAETASASTLAWYAALAVKRGRPAGNRINGNEPLSRYAQVGHGFQVEQRPGHWIDLLVEDKRASVPDQVAAKLDVGAWFARLSKRMQRIARDLALGSSTSDVARMHGVSAGRVSQLRRQLEESWAAFQQERVVALAE